MFETLISDAQTFVRALAKDNTRDWFQAHKSDYDTKLRDPAKALLDHMAPRLSTLTGYPVTTKLFRINRDVRFSKDVLMDWRKMVDLDGGYIAGKITDATAHGYSTWEPKLKRVPSPYDKDHVHGDLLRQKRLVVSGQPDTQGDLPARLETAFTQLWPVADMLIGVAESPTL